MGNFQSLIPRDILDHVIEIVLSELYVEMRAIHQRITNSCLIREEWQTGPIWQWNPDQMEELIARNAAMEEGADLSVRAVVETENRREMLKMVAHLFEGQRSLKAGATWEKLEIEGSDQISVHLVAKYYGREREITLKGEELRFNECETESIHWITMREIGFEMQKAVEKREKREEKAEWWKAGEETVDMTELIKRWKNPERDVFVVHMDYNPASWETIWKLKKLNDANRETTVKIVFNQWKKKNPSRTRGGLRTVEGRILVDITTNVWWVVDFDMK